MNFNSTRMKITGSLLQWVSIALVVAGCVNYIFFNQDFSQAEYFMEGAVFVLFMAAVFYRFGRNEGLNKHAVTNLDKNDPWWHYVFIVSCILVALINSLTTFFDSKYARVGLSAYLIIGLSKLCYDRLIVYRASDESKSKTRIYILILCIFIVFYQAFVFLKPFAYHV